MFPSQMLEISLICGGWPVILESLINTNKRFVDNGGCVIFIGLLFITDTEKS